METRPGRNRLVSAGFRRIAHDKAKFLIAAALLSAATLAPVWPMPATIVTITTCAIGGLPYPISYLHNYGPGPLPGTFAFYDGPSSILCRQSAAAYIGQDRRRHPCYERRRWPCGAKSDNRPLARARSSAG